jgi:hypothetical protein
MAEYCVCEICKKYINLEIDIHRDENNNLICNNCNSVIKDKDN